MTRRGGPTPVSAVGATALTAVASVWLTGCGDHGGSIAPGSGTNLRPGVRIVSGLDEGERVPAAGTTVHVFGSDDDGRVVGYRYAIDAGDAPAPDDPAWVDVERSPLQPRFTATEPGPDGVSESAHTLTVVSVDDRGATSGPLTRRFTATTMSPTTTLVSREPAGVEHVAEYDLDEEIAFTWQGYDPDHPGNGSLRVQWKVIVLPYTLVPAEEVIRDLSDQPDRRPNLLIPDELSVPWGEELPSEAHVRETAWWPPRGEALTEVRFVLPDEVATPGLIYAVAARTVDVALAVTPQTAFAVRENGQPGNVVRVRRSP